MCNYLTFLASRKEISGTDLSLKTGGQKKERRQLTAKLILNNGKLKLPMLTLFSHPQKKYH